MLGGIKKGLPPLLLALLMIGGLLPGLDFILTAHAEGAAIAGNWTDYASVTAPANDGTTYTIASAADLAWVAVQVNSGANNFSGKTLNITANIDLSAHYWAPIGNSATNVFKGIVQGNSYEISGLTIGSAASPDTTYTYAGLFGYINAATISNVALRDVTIYSSSSTYIGGLAAYLGTGATTISGCSVTGSFYNHGTVSAVMGGLLGYRYTNLVQNLTVTNCWSQCVIYSNNLGNTGGIIGDIEGFGNIRNCFATANIYGMNVSGTHNVGGLAGYIANASGVIGSNSMKITNSYSNCIITCEKTDGTLRVGGIAGGSDSSVQAAVAYSNVYTAGTINAGATGSTTGMFIGYAKFGTLTNCYWNNSASPGVANAIGTGTSVSGTPTGMAQMDMMYGGSFLPTLNTNANALRGSDSTIKAWVWASGTNGGFPYPDLSGDGTFPPASSGFGPAVLEPVVSGTAQVGVQLVVDYEYYDAGGVYEDLSGSGTTFQWYRANSDGTGAAAISGETARYYTLTYADAGKNIYYIVTPKNSAGTVGTPVQSAAASVPASPGTEGNPYEIYTLNDLKNIANAPDAYYVLMNDIEGALDSVICPGGTSVFNGGLDGDGHTVTLAITGSGQYTGMFGEVGSSGDIHDLNITGSVSGTQIVGGIAASNQGTISNCNSSAAVVAAGTASSDLWVGGIAGENGGAITDCTVTGTLGATGLTGATISRTVGFGGIAGYNYYDGTAGGITDCRVALTSFSTDVSTFGAVYVGGIAGKNSGSIITGSYTENDVAAGLTGAYSGSGVLVGGIAGEENGGGITECFSTGDVFGSTDAGNVYAGGLAGQCRGSFSDDPPISLLSDSYYYGTVSGTGHVGGIVGYLYYGAMSNCYSAGSVIGIGDATVGGLAGYNDHGKIESCYSNSYGTSTGANGGLYGNGSGAQTSGSYWNRNNTAATGPAEASLSFVQMTDTNASANMPELNFTTPHFVTKSSTATERYFPQLAVFVNSTDPTMQAASLLSVTMGYTAPSITGQPENQAVDAGQTVQFAVTATGSSTLSYQWKKDGSDLTDGVTTDGSTISGAATATVSIAGAVKTDEGSYTCCITDGEDEVTSNAAILTVNIVAPSITTQPSNQTVTVGGTASFTVEVTGKEPLGYQWKKGSANLSDDTRISGAATATLTITGVQDADKGSYTCYVSNTAGNVTSDAATLTVNPTPVLPNVTWQPEDYTASAGWVVEFWIVAQGTAPLSYQWQKGGVNLTNGGNIGGATTNNLIISNVQEADEGNYTCIVTNAAGSVTSDTAALTVNPIGPSIAYQPQNQTKTVGDDVSFTVVAAGSEPFTYQWRKGGANLLDGVAISGATISGATTATLTFSGILEADAGNYSCVISNDYGSVTSNAASLTVNLTYEAPSIILQPVSQTVEAGQGVFFTVEVSGNTPMTYQWYKDDVVPDNALENEGCYTGVTTPRLHIGSIIAAYAGTYTCVVTNAYSSATSDGAVLTVGTSSGTRPTITTASLPDGTLGTPYSYTLTATGSTPISWNIIGNLLPSGLTLNLPEGIINGTPTETGTFHFYVRGENTWGIDEKDFYLTINNILPPTAVVLQTAVADGTSGTTTSTKIDLMFDTDITGLTADDITIINGTGVAVKGALTGSGMNWSIALTSVVTQGDVTVTVAAPSGYSISGSPRTVAVYKAVVPTAVTLQAAVADGVSGATTSTRIGLTFDTVIIGLTAGDITITGVTGSATKGELTGSGKNWSIAISDVSEGTVSVAVASPAGYFVSGSPITVNVYAAPAPPTPVVFQSATADGVSGMTTSTKIDLVFDTDVTGLTAADITITGGTGSATKGELTGSGTSWSIAISGVSEGTVSVAVASPTGYAVTGSPKTVNVYMATSADEILVSVTPFAAITGVENGTTKTASALGLPDKVTLVTNVGHVQASVTWDVYGCPYDPSVTTEQIFTVNGAITLPSDVMNPDNVSLDVSISVTVNAATSIDKTLISITVPADITGMENGTEKTASALGLPAKVTLVTNDGNVQADVTWDVASSSYDPSDNAEQTFTVNGNVTLPSGVINTNNVSLGVSISVTVLAAVPPDKTLASITSPSPITDVANGTEKTAAALGLPERLMLVTNVGHVQASVTWDVYGCPYDPLVTVTQTFTVDGTVILPDGVINPENVPLSTSISVTVNAKSNGDGNNNSGSGSRGASSTPTTPTYNAEVKAGNGTETTLPITVDKDNETASIDTGSQKLTSGETVITVPAIPDVSIYSAGIPVPDLSTPDVQGTLTLHTDNGSITIPSNMLTGVGGISGGKAQIFIGQGDKSTLPEDVKAVIGDKPLVQLTLAIDGKQIDWSNPSAPVTVSIPYTPTAEELKSPESIVVWYIDGGGNAVSVPNGRYDPATGTVTFAATHFSDYAVVYHPIRFNDMASTAWYSKAVNFIAAREITTGIGGGNYGPDAKLTRGEFIVLMMRAYGISPDTNPTDNFADADSTYYTGYLAVAKRLGITSGVGNNMYAPGKEITRQEMFTLLYNALKVIGQLPQGDSGKALDQFTDADQIDAWAKEAMKLLVKSGTAAGSGGKLTPTGTTTRAEMAQVLYNLLGKKY